MGERRTEITGNGDDRRQPYGLVEDELVDGEVLRPRGHVQELRMVQGKIQAGVQGEGRSKLVGIELDAATDVRQWQPKLG